MTGKQLKNSILQWAIQGKLVPQDPNEEPASVLLERIREEKARLVKEKKIKRPKNESIIYRGDDNSYYEKMADGTVRCIDDEIPFDIPSGWEWVRIGEYSMLVTDFVASGSFASLRANVKYYNSPEYAILVRTKDFASEFKKDLVYTDKHGYVFLSNSNLYGGEIILPNIGASIGKVFIVPHLSVRMTLAPNSIMVRFTNEELKMWFYTIFDSQVGKLFLSNITSSTAQGKFNKTEFKQILIPIPPLKEQHRIIDKLQSLIKRCNAYGRLYDKRVHQDKLLNESLRKSILQEAIQGRLVKQCSEDEPASVLLQRIKAEKERLIKEKKIKHDKSESVIFRGDDNCYYEQIGKEVRCIQNEIPFEIPNSWEWARVSSVFWLNPKNEAKDETKAAFIPMEKIDAGFGSSFSYDTVEWKTIKNGYTHFADDDVAFAKITPCFQNRKSAIFNDLPNGIGAGTTELRVLRPFADTFDRFYLLYFLESPYFIDEAKFKGTANQQRIVLGYLENKLIPIPPLEEQHRIVAKIERLFQMLK